MVASYPEVKQGDIYESDQGFYNTFGTAIHTTTEDILVIFTDAFKDGEVYAMPIGEFFNRMEFVPPKDD